jgi:glutamate synthase (NADPH/NADH) small chain
MEYLVQQNKRIGGEALEPSEGIMASGKAVVVIGGGDTGSDCLGTALRQGAKTVYQCEILPKPPSERSASTPWPMWPTMLRRTHTGEEGGEQQWSVMTKRFMGEKGTVKRIHCAEVEWERRLDGSLGTPKEKVGTDFELEADLVFLAMGYVGPGQNKMVESLAIERDARGNIKVDDQHMTNVNGVFVAGDMTQGQSLVVRAIADGRKAAQGIMTYLTG